MSKSKARFLAELLNSEGRVNITSSDLAGADGIIDLAVLPILPNSQLEHSSISIAEHTLSLGGNLSLDTSDLTEHASYLYYTNARADARIVNAGSANWDTAYGWGDHASAGYLTSYINTTYTAGTGLTLIGTVFSNTEPDQIITLTGSGATSVTGTYPNFTITSTDTDTVYTHPSSHPISFITGLQAVLDGKVDDSQVLTNVPAGALFTDTVYTLPFADNSANWNTAYGWGDHSTQSYATQSYVGTAISNLVDSSPATLDTLNELAAALGDDPNFATTVTNAIATKLPLAGGTLTGTLAMGANAITSTGTISSGAITSTGLTVSTTGEVYVATIENLGVAGDKHGLWVKSDSSWSSSNLLRITSGTNDLDAFIVAPDRVYIAPNVGIGDLAPAEKLTVSGNIRASGSYLVGGTEVINSSRQLRSINAIYNTSDTQIMDLGNTTYTILKDPEGSIRMYLGDTGDAGNYYDNTIHYFRNRAAYPQVQISDGGVNLENTSATYKVQGTTVIDSSRNLIAATSTLVSPSGTSIVESIRNPNTSWGQYALTRYGTETANLRYMDFGYYRGATEATRGLVIKSQADATLFTFLDSGEFQIGTTTVIDSSRNISNINAISIGQDISGMDTTNFDLEVVNNASIRGASALYFGVTTAGWGSWKTRIGSNNTSTMYISGQAVEINGYGYSSSAAFGLFNTSGLQILGNTAWHAGNDGSGSGLDADLLDGIDSNSFLRSDADDSFTGNNLLFPSLSLNIANNNGAGSGNTYFRGTNTHFVLGLTSGNTLYMNYGNTAGSFNLSGNVTHNGSNPGTVLWGNSNDGSGSGLDADLLDGVSWENAPSIKSTGLISADNRQVMAVAHWSGAGVSTGAIVIELPGTTNNYSMPVIEITTYEYTGVGHTTYTISGHNWQAGSIWYNAKCTVVGAAGKGIYLGYNSNTNRHCIQIGLASTGWDYGAVTVAVKHHPSYYDSSQDMAGSWNIFQTTNLAGINTGGVSTDVVWHSNNDGSGSGLDADLLDGMNATSSIVGSTVVARDGNGYIYANHINFNTSETENPAINSFLTGNGDGWSRKSSLDHVKNSIRNVADGTWGINITGSAATATDSSKLPLTGGTLSGNLITSGSGNYVLIGGAAANNAYDTVPATTGLMFGGANDPNNYSIGTSTQNVGGNYTKLNIKWHTGLRFFSMPQYGGARFYSDAAMNTETFSINYLDGHVRVANNLYANGGNLVWNGSNDGSGSGLDADLLDGLQGSRYVANQDGSRYTTDFNTILTSGFYNAEATPANAPNSFGQLIVAKGADTGMQIYGGYAHENLWFRGWANSGATFYSWRKAWHDGNDGSGSGLDADLLDGIDSGSFLRSDADDTASGQYLFSKVNDHAIQIGTIRGLAVGSQGGQFIQMYERVNIGGPAGWGESSTTAAPSFGLSTYGGASLATHSGSVTISGNTAWHAGNDGSGSGLDADLLDGLHAHTGINNEVNKVVRTDANGYIQAGWINTISGQNTTEVPSRFYASDDAYLRYYNLQYMRMHLGLTAKNSVTNRLGISTSEAYFTGAQGGPNVNMNDLFNRGSAFIDVWSPTNGPTTAHQTGFQALHYSSSNTYHHGMQMVMGDGNPSQTFLRGWWGNGGTGYAWQKIWTTGNDGAGSGLDADLLDGIDSLSFLRSDAADTFTGTLTMGTQVALVAGNFGRGVFGLYSPSQYQHVWSMGQDYKLADDGASSGAGGNLYGLAWSYNPGYGYAGSNAQARAGFNHQLLLMMNGTSYSAFGNGIWTAGTISSNDQGTLWGSSNDGSGSGLDADLLDGVNGASYLRSDAADTATGALEISTGNTRPLRLTTSSASPWSIDLYRSDLTNSSQVFNSGSSWYFQHNITIGGSTNWHAGNDGSGSGLDADLLDGYNSDNFLGKFGNSYYQANTWIQLSGGNGLYCPQINNAHFTPNATGSYGTWNIIGSRGDYTGIYLAHSGVNIGMYDSGGNGGDYHEASGKWSHYWHRGNTCLAINASTTSAAYSLYVTGAIYATDNITAYSDRRVKENIRTIDNALETVEQMRGVYYNRIDDEEKKTVIGFIAQEVDEVEGAKPLVTYAADVDQYGVSYGNATALLVEAIKELSQQVKDLQKEIKELKND